MASHAWHSRAKCKSPTTCRWHGAQTKPTVQRRGTSAAKKIADLPSNGARETARVLLGQLEALRAKLDERIQAVKELSEIL